MSTGPKESNIVTEARHRLVATLEGRFKDLEIAFHEAYWESQVDASPESEHRRAELELELRKAKGDRQSLESVRDALKDQIHDPVLARQLQVMNLSLTGNQMEDELREEIVALSSSIEGDFSAHRPVLEGRRVSDNEIEVILRNSNDSEQRRQTWEASKEIGSLVAPRVREVVRTRNEAARNLGYADFYRFALDLEELDEAWLFSMMEQLEKLTREPYLEWKDDLDDRLRRRFNTRHIYPWHYADPFFQTLPPDGRVDLDPLLGDASAPVLAEKTFSRWGIDISGVLGASDLYPRERKSQHAFCLDVDRTGSNVRLLTNIVPGERWMEIVLHESGHAAYDISIDEKLPYLLHRPAHTFVTEAIAIISGRFVRDPQWLTDFAGVPVGEVAKFEPSLTAAATALKLLFARWALVVVHFERDLYADPETDLNSRWWELVQRFQALTPPPERSMPDWAAKIHLAAAPAYYQNYLLGEILASQLRATYERECGGFVGSGGAGRLLAERVFRPGSLLRWDSLIEEATGCPLSPDDFAEGLTAGV